MFSALISLETLQDCVQRAKQISPSRTFNHEGPITRAFLGLHDPLHPAHLPTMGLSHRFPPRPRILPGALLRRVADHLVQLAQRPMVEEEGQHQELR